MAVAGGTARRLGRGSTGRASAGPGGAWRDGAGRGRSSSGEWRDQQRMARRDGRFERTRAHAARRGRGRSGGTPRGRSDEAPADGFARERERWGEGEGKLGRGERSGRPIFIGREEGAPGREGRPAAINAIDGGSGFMMMEWMGEGEEELGVGSFRLRGRWGADRGWSWLDGVSSACGTGRARAWRGGGARQRKGGGGERPQVGPMCHRGRGSARVEGAHCHDGPWLGLNQHGRALGFFIFSFIFISQKYK
jgi:hypothetical protein